MDTPRVSVVEAPATPTAPAASAPPNDPGIVTPSSNEAASRAAVTAPLPSKPAATAPVPATRDLGAKELFVSTGANVAPGLRVRMMQAGVNDAPLDVDLAREFRTGDRVRFAFESNIDGFLYVAQQGASGNWTVLFPNEQINGGHNMVKRFEEYEVPGGGWFTLDEHVGTEHVFVFLSREPLKTLPGFERPVKSFQPASGALIAELQSSIQSRDLVFQSDKSGAGKAQPATYVVNKAEVGKAVTASFNLVHK
jgi:hypothetical protein